MPQQCHSGRRCATSPTAARTTSRWRPNEGTVEHDGFNLHASVAIEADDDLGRERLCRHGARPPLALERLRHLPDGRCRGAAAAGSEGGWLG